MYMNSDQGQWLILIGIPLMKWTCSPNYINSPFDKLCLSRVTIVTKLSVTDYRGGACLWERLQQLGGQPDPDHRVHHRLPHPQPRVPRHHHLWPGDPHGHHDPDNIDTMLREWPLTPWTRFSKRDSRTGCGPRDWTLTVTRLAVDRVKPWLTKMINSSSSNTMIRIGKLDLGHLIKLLG